jgi:ATP-dependent Lon protease
VLEARDALERRGVWPALARTLRTGKLELAGGDAAFPGERPLQPEPVDVSVKVVMLGDQLLFELLDSLDPDFRLLFQVLVDFDETIPRDARGLKYYASVLAYIAREERLPPFTRDAMIVLAEQGARMAAQPARLSARFGRLADLAREAAFLAREAGGKRVKGEDVSAAIARVRARADLPVRKFLELVSRDAIRVHTRGEVTGQVNGLAVTQSGPLTYGFPARITATIGPGTAGTIDIERESLLSGSIHTKGFLILSGLLLRVGASDHGIGELRQRQVPSLSAWAMSR